MPFEPPRSLSPSSLSTFTNCALQFRFTMIDRLPEPPSVAATRGTLVHAALEHLFTLPEGERVASVGPQIVDAAVERMRSHPDWIGLGLDDAAEATMRDEALALVANYFQLEDPTAINPIGLELKMEVEVDGVVFRGIIDRLDLVDGALVVTDYKTGRAPGQQYTRSKMSGIQLYSMMCERTFGRRPAKIRLLHLAEPVVIETEPTEQSQRGYEKRLGAVWSAVESACEREDFRPRPSKLCNWCSFQQWCPSFGGDPDRAERELRAQLEVLAREADGQSPLVQA